MKIAALYQAPRSEQYDPERPDMMPFRSRVMPNDLFLGIKSNVATWRGDVYTISSGYRGRGLYCIRNLGDPMAVTVEVVFVSAHLTWVLCVQDRLFFGDERLGTPSIWMAEP